MISALTCLWFDGRAVEAAEFYASLVPNSEVLFVAANPEVTPGATGEPMWVRFRLAGQEYALLNGGPTYKLSPAASIMLTCETQTEIDRLWDALLADGGQAMACGWLTDRFGVSWQIAPAALDRWFSSGETERIDRVMAAVMSMVKLDLPVLESAWAGETQPA